MGTEPKVKGQVILKDGTEVNSYEEQYGLPIQTHTPHKWAMIDMESGAIYVLSHKFHPETKWPPIPGRRLIRIPRRKNNKRWKLLAQILGVNSPPKSTPPTTTPDETPPHYETPETTRRRVQIRNDINQRTFEYLKDNLLITIDDNSTPAQCGGEVRGTLGVKVILSLRSPTSDKFEVISESTAVLD